MVLGYFCLHGSEYIDDAHTIRCRSTQLTDCKRAACEGVHKSIGSCGLMRWSERRRFYGRMRAGGRGWVLAMLQLALGRQVAGALKN